MSGNASIHERCIFLDWGEVADRACNRLTCTGSAKALCTVWI
jgi:hypothetical protein